MARATVLKRFELSPEAAGTLEAYAKETGQSQTAVIEAACLLLARVERPDSIARTPASPDIPVKIGGKIERPPLDPIGDLPGVKEKRKATLKIWNGRGWNQRGGVKHCYVAAYSRADAVRVINEAAGYRAVSDSEIKEYYSEGSWGTRMIGITPERGVWIQRTEHDKPQRLFPD